MTAKTPEVIQLTGTTPALPAPAIRSFWHDFWARFRQNRLALISLVLIGLLVMTAILGPVVYTVSPTDISPDFEINAFPSADHLMGTDNAGRDTLARLIYGLRVSLVVAVFVEGLNIGLGASLGLLAGYFGGWFDFVIARAADMLFAFPGLLLAILVSAVFGPAAEDQFGGMGRLLIVAGALSLVSWPLMARYVRGQTLSLRERDFVLASRSVGATDGFILTRHILPNLIGLVVVSSTLDIANVVISEAVLSLLGLGIQPPDSSLGIMITQATPFLVDNWTQVFFPSAALSLIVLAVSFLGDGLRDALDPQTVRRV
ncbi:MAG TPA: ABC transporter permease [Aggregatilineales bacterium]|nr:ABC transporter permease [Aggregatilineales bacterium]